MFNFFGNDINSGVKEFNAQKNAVLLDVRTREEFEEGHIPKSVNLPLDEIQKIEEFVSDKNTKIYTYCYSGARSADATRKLNFLGYVNTENIGGIASYKGEIER